MSDDILMNVSDGVAVITFNRPDAMNTFTAGMMDGLLRTPRTQVDLQCYPGVA